MRITEQDDTSAGPGFRKKAWKIAKKLLIGLTGIGVIGGISLWIKGCIERPPGIKVVVTEFSAAYGAETIFGSDTLVVISDDIQYKVVATKNRRPCLEYWFSKDNANFYVQERYNQGSADSVSVWIDGSKKTEDYIDEHWDRLNNFLDKMRVIVKDSADAKLLRDKNQLDGIIKKKDAINQTEDSLNGKTASLNNNPGISVAGWKGAFRKQPETTYRKPFVNDKFTRQKTVNRA